ncbi:MAG: helix-turn-helix transcriptional regulator [Oscillospiraceae bacterium]|nr:helix-turn-helix transcriptional regulator [Oscillospiraceae bacterium]
MDQNQIGKFIASERKERQLTQQQLAERLGISNKTVSKWECGNGFPDVSLMQALCKELDLDVSELLAGKRLESAALKKQAEENLLTQIRLQQQTKRSKIRFLYCTVAFNAVAMSIVIYVVAKFTDVLPDNIKGILIVFFGWMLGLSIFAALIQERKNAMYKCPKCETSFQPSAIGFLLSPKKMNNRWLKCPHCHKFVRCSRHF